MAPLPHSIRRPPLPPPPPLLPLPRLPLRFSPRLLPRPPPIHSSRATVRHPCFHTPARIPPPSIMHPPLLPPSRPPSTFLLPPTEALAEEAATRLLCLQDALSPLRRTRPHRLSILLPCLPPNHTPPLRTHRSVCLLTWGPLGASKKAIGLTLRITSSKNNRISSNRSSNSYRITSSTTGYSRHHSHSDHSRFQA